jgi:hypothetical protein
MKNIAFILIFIVFILSCKKDYSDTKLPDTVEFGKSEIFLNGEKLAFLPIIQNDTFQKTLNFSFKQSLDSKSIINVVGFDFLPLEVNNFNLSDEFILYKNAHAAFNQVVDEDLIGYEYELVDIEDGLFNIESLDTIKFEVSGRFQVKFCRTSRNGNFNLELPKTLVFQGVFNDSYTKK